jgi:hypothetical protein
MRALFTLAAVLGTTAAALLHGLSAQEFARWQAWLEAERVGPAWDARRHAELMAAVHNGGRVARAGGGLFTVADFMQPDPWAPAAPAAADLTPQQMKALHDAWLLEQEA